MTEIEKIIVEYTVRIKHFFLKKGFQNEDLEDLIQESLLEIIKSIDTYKHKSTLSTWIYAICQNIYRNNIYKKERFRKTIKKIEEIQEESHKLEDQIFLKIATESLNRTDYIIYKYYYFDGRKIKEIALLLSIPSGTIKYRLYCIRRKLRDQLT